VKRLPASSAPDFDVSVSSREIDTEVRRRLRSGEPLYHIHGDVIRELQADLLISQSHCEVCAPRLKVRHVSVILTERLRENVVQQSLTSSFRENEPCAWQLSDERLELFAPSGARLKFVRAGKLDAEIRFKHVRVDTQSE
jgi:hypothetical protein